MYQTIFYFKGQSNPFDYILTTLLNFKDKNIEIQDYQLNLCDWEVGQLMGGN
jgi:hypothetical protein